MMEDVKIKLGQGKLFKVNNPLVSNTVPRVDVVGTQQVNELIKG